MSDDPRRWSLEGAGSTRDEREILRAAAGAPVDPPPGSEKAVWAALALHIGAGGAGAAGGAGGAGGAAGAGGGAGAGQAAGSAAAGGGSAAAAGGGTAAGGAAAGGTAGAAGAAGAAGMIKSVLIGAASAGLLIVGYTVLGPDSPAPPSTEPEVAVVAPSEPDPAAPKPPAPSPPETAAPVIPSVNDANPGEPPANRAGRAPPTEAAPSPEAAPTPTAAPEPTSEAAPAPTAAASAQPLTPAERANQMREESLLLNEARETLRRGNPSGALAKLEEARARFGGSMLGQEREALTIEALHKSGQKAAASARAAAFLRAYPRSPHAARLQAFVQ